MISILQMEDGWGADGDRNAQVSYRTMLLPDLFIDGGSPSSPGQGKPPLPG